jgi:hypothetical protein
MRTSPFILGVLATLAGPALAQPAPLLPERDPPGARRHDGFYLRLGVGFGGYSEAISVEDADESTTISGIASVSELAIGGTVLPGLVVGGGVWTSSVLSSERNIDGMLPPDEVIGGSGNFTLLGPFVDLYFRPRSGLHLQAAAGLATIRGWDLPEAQDNPDAVSVGGGAMVGFGYDWWVGDEWSIGILARLAAVVGVQEDEMGNTWVHAIGSSPALLFTATFH